MPEPSTPKQLKEKGAALVEYAMVVLLIAIIAITAVRVVGQEVQKPFQSVSNSFDAYN